MWIDAVLPHRLSRCQGYDRQSKMFAGMGSGECSCLCDGTMYVSGCMNRSIAVMVVESFQRSHYTDSLGKSQYGSGTCIGGWT